MGRDKPAPVGYRRPQVGYLERSSQYLPLPDGYADDSQSVPRAPICVVIKLRIGYQPALFAGQIRAELVAESLRHHVVFPHRDGVLGRIVFLTVAEHVVQPPAEVGVARSGDGRHQGEGRSVPVATYPQSAMDKTMGTRISGRVLADDALLEERHRLRRLEGAARRISALDGAVQQGLSRVFLQGNVVLAPLPADEQVRVERRRGYHAKDFARLRLDGHYASDLVLHQAFAQHLQVDVQAQLQVLPRNGGTVQLPVHIMPLDASVRVAQQDFHAFLPPQILFVALFDALLANVVAAAVVIVFFDVAP